MARVTGIGGIFFKAKDDEGLKRWYGEQLGIKFQEGNVAVFQWRDHDDPKREGSTVWNAFPKDTRYFDPSPAPFMVNFRVNGLDDLLDKLRKSGAQVDPKVETYDYGRFAWVMDPEGNRIELWEPVEEK